MSRNRPFNKTKWDIFVCHASEDKSIARSIRLSLTERGARVWMDEGELKLGDSLRSNIEHGLAHSRYGVVILSQAFFLKSWPQKELNGLFARESPKRKVILPVWHGVEQEYVALHCPILADKLAVSTDKGPESVAESIMLALQKRSLQETGVTRISLKEPDLPELIASAEERIFLTAMGFTYFGNVDSFTTRKGVYAFDEPAEAGVLIRVLAMDPKAQVFSDRAKVLTSTNIDLAIRREEDFKNLQTFHARYKKYDNVSLRLYNGLPLNDLLVVDDLVVTSVMTRVSRSGLRLTSIWSEAAAPKAIEDFTTQFGESSDFVAR